MASKEVEKRLTSLMYKIEECNEKELIKLEKEYGEILKKEYNSEYTSLLQRCFYLK